MIISVEPDNPDKKIVTVIANFIKAREIVILPTDTIYGFSCLAMSPYALKELGEIKGDGLRTRIILILKKWVEDYIEYSARYEVLYKLWPSPLTMIFTAKEGIFPPSLYNTQGGVAFRVPDSPFLLKLLEEVGEPIVSTSLNKPGEAPLTQPENIAVLFGSRFPLLVIAGELKSPPSTIISCENFPSIKFVRDGKVSRAELTRRLTALGLIRK